MALIDDDAYPVPGWLAAAARHFLRTDIVGVGGPGITPPSDDPSQQTSGAVYASSLVSAGYTYRYLPAPAREVDEPAILQFNRAPGTLPRARPVVSALLARRRHEALHAPRPRPRECGLSMTPRWPFSIIADAWSGALSARSGTMLFIGASSRSVTPRRRSGSIFRSVGVLAWEHRICSLFGLSAGARSVACPGRDLCRRGCAQRRG